MEKLKLLSVGLDSESPFETAVPSVFSCDTIIDILVVLPVLAGSQLFSSYFN